MTRPTASTTSGKTSRSTGRNLALAALLSLATCNEQGGETAGASIRPTLKRLGTVPSTEIARWERRVSVTAPEGRFLQAVAYDETRNLVVMFGGENRPATGGVVTPMQDTWEWSPTTGAWTLRPTSGPVPAARAGAAMVFDPDRNKMLLFGGRASSGYNYEDLWEWEPTTGAWTERSTAGTHPSARAQLGMVYQTSTGKILLFGGGRSSATTSDGSSVSTSLGDTWELDPSTATWTALAPAASPSQRHDFGLVWDSARDKVVLFGGMQIDIPGATGVPKQDTWEWDPADHTWTERTLAGVKPSQRYGHAMAFDGSSGEVVVFGGWDMITTGSKNDLWDWDPTTGAWTQRLSGSEGGLPAARTFASMAYDPARSRVALVGGLVAYVGAGGGMYGLVGSNEVWELDLATASFTDRSTDYQVPTARQYHAMAYSPTTGRTYVFGGVDPTRKSEELNDLWEWDGVNWSKVVTDIRPEGRVDGAMAYDPVRQSLILFGGNSWTTGYLPNDTWEWSESTRQWTQLSLRGNPSPRWGHAMVTDTTRDKILMFGGSVSTPDGAAELWEWDGGTQKWTNRSPADTALAPTGRNYPVVSFDEGLGKLVVYDGSRVDAGGSATNSSFWEWDVVSGGWIYHNLFDELPDSPNVYAVFDSARRRHVFFTDVVENNVGQTWELDAKTYTWYVRSLEDMPAGRFRAAMVYDSVRRAVVLFGGALNVAPGGPSDETWEYTVTNLANGEGCTAASSATCASGNCVDGVCCESAGCTGECMSCSVPGSEGTCVLAQAGTEVPGSCAEGQACDGTGSCKSKNGQPCSDGSSCASGNCIDGICCDDGCGGTCRSCNLPGSVGLCAPIPAGTDPNDECGQGTGVCKSTCDGVGACSFPLVTCGDCLACDGAGTCSRPDPACFGGSGGSVPGKGGMGGSMKGGAGGKPDLGGAGGAGGMAGQGGGIGGIGGGPSGGAGGAASSGIGGGPSGGSGGPTTSGAGGVIAGSGGSVSVDAGNTAARGGAGGSSGGASGGSSGGSWDGGSVKRDGSGVGTDGGVVAAIHRGGCSCEVGRGHDAASVWLLLIGAALLFRRIRRSRW